MSQSQACVKAVFQGSNRKLMVPRNVTFDQFMQILGDEYGFPVGITQYEDLEGDIITLGDEKPILELNLLLNNQTSRQTFGHDIKVYLRSLKRPSAGSGAEAARISSPSMRKRASSASRDQLPFPSAVSPTSGRRISDADLEGNGQASPKVIVVRTKSSAEIPSRRGSVHRVAAEDSPLSARRSASSPRGFDPLEGRRFSMESRRSSADGTEDMDEIVQLAAAEYRAEVMGWGGSTGSPALSRTPPSINSPLSDMRADSQGNILGGDFSEPTSESDTSESGFDGFASSESDPDEPPPVLERAPQGRSPGFLSKRPPAIDVSPSFDFEAPSAVQRTPSKQSPSSPFGGAGSASDSSDYNTFGTVRVINLPTYLQDPFPDGRTRDVGNAHSPTSPSGRQPPEAATKKPKHKKKQKQDGKPGKDHQPSSSTDDLVGRRASDAPSPSIAPFTWKKGRLLGKGAFGSVYEGLTSSGKIIAVKHLELAADVNPEKSSHYQTFRKEIELLKSFKHANIVQYYGSHIEKNNIYVFLEYVPGGSISSMLSKYGQFDEELIRVYAQQILLGLRYLHANRVAHRDIKGANILVDTKGHAKLADFGCSKSIEGIVSEMFNTMLGTPYWMAPEVMRQEGHGRKADIWSFACTIIEMASGKPPWADQYTQVAAFLYDIASSQKLPEIPDHLTDLGKDFLQCCLRRSPSERPTAEQLLRHPWLVDVTSDSEGGSQSPRGDLGRPLGASSSANKLRVSGGKNPVGALPGKKGIAQLSLSASLTQAMSFAKLQFDALPRDVAFAIFNFLEASDICHVAQVCAHWRVLAESNPVWKQKCLNSWPKMRSTTSIADADEDYESSDSHGYWKKTFASRSKREARWRNVAQKADLKVLKGHTKAVYCVQFVAHGKRLVTGSADKKIKIWDLESATDASSKKAAVTLKGHSGSVKCIHANPNMVFSGSSDHTVRLWDLKSMKCALTLKSHESAVTCLQFDQTKLVSGSLDGTLKLWDLKNGTSLLDTIKVPTRSKKTVGVTAMKLRDNLILTGGFDKVAQLWDIRLKESERCIRTFDGHMDELSVVAFSGPSTFLSASLDGTIREWDIAYSESKSLFSLQESGADSPPLLRRHAKIHAMHFDGENTIFAARSDGKVTVWDYNSEAPISTVQVMESSLFGLDKAGDVLVSSGSDKVVSLFSLVPANRP